MMSNEFQIFNYWVQHIQNLYDGIGKNSWTQKRFYSDTHKNRILYYTEKKDHEIISNLTKYVFSIFHIVWKFSALLRVSRVSFNRYKKHRLICQKSLKLPFITCINPIFICIQIQTEKNKLENLENKVVIIHFWIN